MLLKATEHNLSYSFSRWTDVPSTYWDWFLSRLKAGSFAGFSCLSLMPQAWSLSPEDVLGLVFWTKDPTHLIRDVALLRDFRVKVKFTLTAWSEVEPGAPSLVTGLDLMAGVVDAFGPQNVSWRVSPIPMVPDFLDRWRVMADRARSLGLKHADVAFLQPNPRLPETRSVSQRVALLKAMSQEFPVRLCREDRSLFGEIPTAALSTGICESGSSFSVPTRVEDCGCAQAVDAFSSNETCRMACHYCYASDTETSPHKRYTLKVL